MKKYIFIFLSVLYLVLGSCFALEYNNNGDCYNNTYKPITAKVEMENPSKGIYIFKIDTKKYGAKIKPFVSQKLSTPQKVLEDNCFELVVNGGFFDVQNGKNVSYVTIDRVLQEEILENKPLTEGLKKQERLEKVLSRGELRILEKCRCKNNKNSRLKFEIASHTDEIPDGYSLKHSLQAGPILSPEMDLVKEGFVIYENDMVKFQSVDILKRRERTALALKGKYLYIILFTKDNKVDANEMAEYIKDKINPSQILALDGGLSTAISTKDLNIGSMGNSENTYQRRVKSFLVIEK